MRKFTKAFAGTIVAGAMALAASAQAAVLDVTGTGAGDSFASINETQPGVYGAEIRGGDSGRRATWEIGLGTQTSWNAASFNEANFDWGAGADVAFEYRYNAGAASTLTIGGRTLSWGNGGDEAFFKAGNAIRISANRQALVNLTSVNDTPFARRISPGYSSNPLSARVLGISGT